MREPEKRIREQRTIDATKENLMGLGGKFGCIMKYLGQPIYEEGGGGIETNLFIAPWHEEWVDDDSDIKEASEEDNKFILGWMFDGTSSGIHLEIKYIETRHTLSVHWQGHLVYEEIRGELEAYVPKKDWQEKVNMLYQRARAREKVAQRAEMQEQKAEIEKEKKGFLAKLRERWGI